MLDAVNAHRRQYGKQSVGPDAIRRVEFMASGHFDYVTKFALGCVDLVKE